MFTLLFMITIGVVIWLALRPTPEPSLSSSPEAPTH
ncbi:Uncharacterised protein [Mycobacteroides abscessus subsp. abscessus]|nr:Uncharacterised protein [Mycobacteroides abscessus subsp. abscessus]SIC60002.1 Uncharacterised protein [Mycobacteroides abscessus subsp. abscessus]